MCRSTTCLLAVAVVVAGLAVVFERGFRPEARAFDQEVIAAIAARATKVFFFFFDRSATERAS